METLIQSQHCSFEPPKTAGLVKEEPLTGKEGGEAVTPRRWRTVVNPQPIPSPDHNHRWLRSTLTILPNIADLVNKAMRVVE